jgi:hypothetical protein
MIANIKRTVQRIHIVPFLSSFVVVIEKLRTANVYKSLSLNNHTESFPECLHNYPQKTRESDIVF